MPGTVLRAGDVAANKTHLLSCSSHPIINKGADTPASCPQNTKKTSDVGQRQNGVGAVLGGLVTENLSEEMPFV